MTYTRKHNSFHHLKPWHTHANTTTITFQQEKTLQDCSLKHTRCNLNEAQRKWNSSINNWAKHKTKSYKTQLETRCHNSSASEPALDVMQDKRCWQIWIRNKQWTLITWNVLSRSFSQLHKTHRTVQTHRDSDMHSQTQTWHTHTHTHTQTHTHTHPKTRTRTHKHEHTQTRAHTHTQTRAHANSYKPSRWWISSPSFELWELTTCELIPTVSTQT